MSNQQQPGNGGSFTRHVAKKALAPIVASAATAITAYLIRKAAEVWEQHLQPKIEERGGGKAAASDAIESVRERLPESASEKLDSLSSKVEEAPKGRAGTSPKSADDADRNAERRKREQRRRQRRKALDQAGSG